MQTQLIFSGGRCYLNDISNSPGKYISILYRYFQKFISRELQELDIGSGQYSFLITLYKKDGISQESLVEALGIDKGTTARAILNLSEKGYIKREVDPNDRRSYRIFLTEKAFKAQPYINDALLRLNEIIMSGFSESERETASRILNKMAENIVRHFQNKTG